jgi:hypothetical protein
MHFSLSADNEEGGGDEGDALVGIGITDTPFGGAITDTPVGGATNARRVTLEVPDQPTSKRPATPHYDTPRPSKLLKLGRTGDAAAAAIRGLDPEAREAASVLRSLDPNAGVSVATAEECKEDRTPTHSRGESSAWLEFNTTETGDVEVNATETGDDDAKVGSSAFAAAKHEPTLGDRGHEEVVRVYKRMEVSIVSKSWAESKFRADQIAGGRIPTTPFGLFWRGRQHRGHWSFAVGDLPDGETARVGKDVIDYLQEKDLE